MADPALISILDRGISAWNLWRVEGNVARPNLRNANLSRAALEGADFTAVDLRGAVLRDAHLSGADLSFADLSEADLSGAEVVEADLSWSRLHRAKLDAADFTCADLGNVDFTGTTLIGAKLVEARLRATDLTTAAVRAACFDGADLRCAALQGLDLSGIAFRHADLTDADLSETCLHGADLTGATLVRTKLHGARLQRAIFRSANLNGTDLTNSVLVNTDLEGATITNCRVFGISIWEVRLQNATQANLTITPLGAPVVQVDSLGVAQFVFLMLNNRDIRNAIDAVVSKLVLLIGRFTDERKSVLDALRLRLREHGYVPVLLDWPRPDSRDLTETVSLLAHLSRFIVADLTDAKSIPQELGAIIPNLPSVPVQPLLWADDPEYGMFEHFKRYSSVLPVYVYRNKEELLAELGPRVVLPAEAKLQELQSAR